MLGRATDDTLTRAYLSSLVACAGREFGLGRTLTGVLAAGTLKPFCQENWFLLRTGFC